MKRAQDLGAALLIVPGFLVALALPVFWPSPVTWLACGLYFGWLGHVAYASYRQRPNA